MELSVRRMTDHHYALTPSTPGKGRNLSFNRVTSAAGRHLVSVISDARHGALLKFLAVSSRALFLLFVATRLAPGELTQYVFITSVAVIAARILGVGLEEHFPLLVAGNKTTLQGFLPIVNVLVLIQALLAACILLFGLTLLTPVLLTTCYITTSFLAGLIRTVRVTGSERLRDLHWFAFGLLALLPVSWTANNLVLLMCACLMMVHWIEIHLNHGSGISHAWVWSQINNVFTSLAEPIKQSWRKLVAGAMLLLMVRGIILWPKALGFEGILDDIAYALLLGEAFWQTAMIVVYRRFAFYCAFEGAFKRILKDAVINVAVLCGYAGLACSVAVALAMMNVEIAGFSNWPAVAWMIIFFGALSGYLLIRYLIWVHRDFDWRLTGFEITLVAAQGVIVTMLAQGYWPMGLAISALILLSVALIFATRTTSGTEKGPGQPTGSNQR